MGTALVQPVFKFWLYYDIDIPINKVINVFKKKHPPPKKKMYSFFSNLPEVLMHIVLVEYG